MLMDFPAAKISDVFRALGSSPEGLTLVEAKLRLSKNGPNSLAEPDHYSRWRTLFKQLANPLIYLLIGAGLISFFIGEKINAEVIAGAVLINVIIGFIQEDRANTALSKLKKLVEHRVIVQRSGREREILSDQIVVGDVLILRAGQLISADGRIFQEDDLEVNEASLTGESAAVEKTIQPVAVAAGLADRSSMIYGGTSILSGNGLAVVTATGRSTEIGKISDLVKQVGGGATPLQERLRRVSKFLSLAVIITAFFIILVGLLSGRDFWEIFIAAVAVAVAAVPEGLTVMVTVILAIGLQQIVKKKALARRLLAAETLGSITVICSDKTGTLTEGKMRLEEIVSLSGSLSLAKLVGHSDAKKLADWLLALKIGVLCNNATLNPETHQPSGGLTLEGEFLQVADDLGINQIELNKQEPRLAELPFTSEKKFMISLHQRSGAYVLYEKGAGEILLEKCSYLEDRGKIRALTADDKKKIYSLYDNLTLQGRRVIALAYRELKQLPFTLDDEHKDWAKVDQELIFVGLASFKDPLRAEAVKTIALCQQAGIRPVIITGDHPNTALAIGQELGFNLGAVGVVTGDLLDTLNDAELQNLAGEVVIYARVSPGHKLRIVKAFQARGEVVAMTGDGLNDSPALKAADIGICLGSGTEVAKETADLVLLDDNFSVIVAAVKQGRIIFDNIRKSITYLVSDCFSEIILLLGSIIWQTPLALLPTQILWINIVNDGLPTFSLAFENSGEGVMRRKPISRRESIFTSEMKMIIFGIGLFRDVLLFFLFYYFSQHLDILGWNLNYLRTLFVAILVIKSLTSIFSLRSFERPIYKINHGHNPYLFWAAASGVGLLLVAIYWLPLNELLQTTPLRLSAWLIVSAVAVINTIMIEAVKAWFIKKKSLGAS